MKPIWIAPKDGTIILVPGSTLWLEAKWSKLHNMWVANGWTATINQPQQKFKFGHPKVWLEWEEQMIGRPHGNKVQRIQWIGTTEWYRMEDVV